MTSQLASRIRVVTVVGDIQPTTLITSIAAEFTHALTAQLPGATDSGDRPIVDLSHHADQLLDVPTATVSALVNTLLDADIVVAASPVYHASYSGVLKLCFDHVPPGALGDALALPVLVGDDATDSSRADFHLRSVLTELGASLPMPSFAITEAGAAESAGEATRWMRDHAGGIASRCGFNGALPAMLPCRQPNQNRHDHGGHHETA